MCKKLIAIYFQNVLLFCRTVNSLKCFTFTYLQELRGPPTISGLQTGKVTAARWQWYGAMDAALRGQHSPIQPTLVVPNTSAAADGVVDTPAFAPSVEEGRKGRRKMPDSTQILLGQLGIPKCISPQPATIVESTERNPHNCKLYFQTITISFTKQPLLLNKINNVFFLGTTQETQALIEWREANGNLFTGRRNSSINGWE